MLAYNCQIVGTCRSPVILCDASTVMRPLVVLSRLSTFNQNSFKHLKTERVYIETGHRWRMNAKSPLLRAPGRVPPADGRVSQICDAALSPPAYSSVSGPTGILPRFPRATCSCLKIHSKHRHTALVFLHRRHLSSALPWASLVFVVCLGIQVSICRAHVLIVLALHVWKWEGGGRPPILQSEVKNIRLGVK